MRAVRIAVSLAAVLAVALLTACGGAAGGGGEGAEQPDPQQAFLQSMVPHHRSAVEMAELAETEAETDFVKGVSRDIVSSQNEEIEQMQRIHERLFGQPLQPSMGAHSALGLSAEEAGMNNTDAARMLRGQEPFDRAFVDHMVPHHEGAVRMSEAVLAKSRDRELRELAEEIIAAQKKEIAEMRRFREREYGAAPPPAREMGSHGG